MQHVSIKIYPNGIYLRVKNLYVSLYYCRMMMTAFPSFCIIDFEHSLSFNHLTVFGFLFVGNWNRSITQKSMLELATSFQQDLSTWPTIATQAASFRPNKSPASTIGSKNWPLTPFQRLGMFVVSPLLLLGALLVGVWRIQHKQYPYHKRGSILHGTFGVALQTLGTKKKERTYERVPIAEEEWDPTILLLLLILSYTIKNNNKLKTPCVYVYVWS